MDRLKKSTGRNIAASRSQIPGKVISFHLIFTMMTITSLFLLLLLLNACSTAIQRPAPPSSPPVVREPSFSTQEYEINIGDQLDIKFFYTPQLNEEVTVRPDGRISLQLAHEVMVAGLTPTELTEILKEKYSKEIIEPEITVIVKSFEAQRVYVDGEVNTPRMIKLVGDMTVLQSISHAGGLKDTARRNEVVVIRRKADNYPFVIPVNLEAAINGTNINQDIVLLPSDIVYVPKSHIADVNLWVKQYIKNNIPINVGYSLGVWGSSD